MASSSDTIPTITSSEIKPTAMAEARGSATSTTEDATSTDLPAPIVSLDERITAAISALNAQDRLLTVTSGQAIQAVETAEDALAAANQQLSQAQISTATNKPIIDDRRGAIAKLFGLTLEEFENDHSAQELLEPYKLLIPKASAKTSTAMTEGERSSKRRRTTLGNHATASNMDTSGGDSVMASATRARTPAQRMSLADTPSRNVMVSTGKSTPPTSKPMEVYHQYATTYVPIDQEKTKWVELRCSECGGNASPSWKIPMKGARGFQMHLQQQHGMEKLKQRDVAELCYYRDIEQSELDDLAKNGAKVAAKGEWWVDIILCAGKGSDRRPKERTSMTMMRSDELNDAEITAPVAKPVAAKPKQKGSLRQDSSQEDEEDRMVLVDEDLDTPLAAPRPQTSTGKLKAVGRRSLGQD